MTQARRFAIGLRTLLAGVALACTGAAHAAKPLNTSPAEDAMLPDWCRYTMSYAPGEIYNPDFQLYQQRYGKGWDGMHHFCWALIDIGRLERPGTTPERRRWIADAAIGNFQYVLDHSPRDFVFRIETWYWIARLHYRVGRVPQALEALSNLIAEWPRHDAGYALMIEYLVESGRADDARAVYRRAEKVVETRARLDALADRHRLR